MNNNEYIKKCLDLGVLLKIYYENKYVYLLCDSFFKKLKIHSNKKPQKKYYDIIFMKEFDIDNIKINSYEFTFLPKKENLDYYLKNNIQIYSQDNKCKKNTINHINFLKKEIRRLYKNFLKNFYTNDDGQLSIFHYNYGKKEIKINDAKIFIRKFFYEFIYKNNASLENSDESLLDGFLILGVSKENVNCCDDIFIESLKKIWFKKIIIEKNKAIDEIKNVDTSSLSEIHKNIFENEKKEIIEIFNSSIKLEDMKHLKTPLDIISYWPEILPKKPYYVNQR
jgi:hypothetical protein